jgi:acyl carrier protein
VKGAELRATKIRGALRNFILSSFLPGEAPETLEDSTLLVSGGVITSLALLELVTFIEDRFSVTLEGDDLGIARMDSIDSMVDLIAERAGPDARRVAD